MIDLVLADPGEQIVGLDIDLDTLDGPRLEVDLFGPHHVEIETGNRQAALLVDPLTPALHDDGVDEHRRGLFGKAMGEDAHGPAHLGTGQTNAVPVFHGHQHALAQLDNVAVEVRYLRRHPA